MSKLFLGQKAVIGAHSHLKLGVGLKEPILHEVNHMLLKGGVRLSAYAALLSLYIFV